MRRWWQVFRQWGFRFWSARGKVSWPRWWTALWPRRGVWRKLGWAAGVLVLVVLAYYWGRWGGLSAATANPPTTTGLLEARPSWASRDYGNRPVAWIYGNIPITREDLGEYLIARYGPERIEFLVNRTIIDHECKAKGITVTDAEVEAQLVEDLRSMGITRVEDFVNQILRRFNKTLYEYKEDVIRPKLAMIKLVRPTITVTEQDERDAFEAHYGPKVHCRMIVLPKGMSDREKLELWTKISSSAEEFDKAASSQFLPALAAKGGDAPPIHRHFANKEIEEKAFALKPGELSPIISMPDGTAVILKCVEHLPPDTNHRFEEERLALHKECLEARLLQEIPRYFQKLREQAAPRIFLRRDTTPEEEIRRADALLKASLAADPAHPAVAPVASPRPLSAAPNSGPDPRTLLGSPATHTP